MFSRLELREILTHLNTNTCDEEVVAKLRELANMPSQQPTQTPVRQRDPVPSLREPAVRSIANVDPIETHPIITNMRREDYQHLDDASYEALIVSRKLSLRQDIAKAGAIPMNAMAPPEVHDRRLENVPVGSKNSAGDRCVGMMANGFSIYACKNGHGYNDTNPAAPIGCPTCIHEGEALQPARVEDDTLIPGEEPF